MKYEDFKAVCKWLQTEQVSLDLNEDEIKQEYSLFKSENKLEQAEQLALTDVVNSVYVVTERDNYGEQLFKQVFASRDKAVGYLAEQGLKEGNVDEITEIELN